MQEGGYDSVSNRGAPARHRERPIVRVVRAKARHAGTGGAITAPSVLVAAEPMPREPTQAGRFGRARRARSAALVEDYVELIDDLLASGGEARTVDIARRLGVSHATVIKTVSRLKREALATAKPYRGVFLTEAGQALAAKVRARHRIVVELLVTVGVPLEEAEADAEGIEHHVSDTTLQAFARFLHSRA